MAQIQVKFDNTLEHSPIIVPLVTPAPDESSETNPNPQVNQTMFYGVAAPLIKINDIVLDINQILYFELDGTKAIPRLYMEIEDAGHKIRGLQNPGPDNEVRVQILPRFDNAYKKIDLTFYIKSLSTEGNIMRFCCIYKVLDLYNSRVKCFGEMSSYEFFEKIAGELRLGFATNVEEVADDTRYIYCANDSYESTMNQVIGSSGDSGNNIDSRILYDYWIDFWNNINFVDIYERYNSVDSDEDMMVWIAPLSIDYSVESNSEDIYTNVVACVSNDPIRQGTELFINGYKPINKPNQSSAGSDKVLSIYSMKDRESLDYLLSDGDQQKDIFVKYEYVGECYRDFNYLLASRCRETMKNKMLEQVIEVELLSPNMSLVRGGKLNVEWYDTDQTLQDTKDRLNIKEEDISTNIPIQPIPEYTDGPTFRINKQVSGQYYILGSTIRYSAGQWINTLKLTRPRDTKQVYLDISEETKDIK